MSQAAGPRGPHVVGMSLDVNAAISNALFDSFDKHKLAAGLGEFDSVFQAPGVQLFIGASGQPVKVEAVGVLESHGVVD